MVEIEKRRLVKTLTWRLLAVMVTIIVAFIFTGSIEISLGIGTAEIILKSILYYVHERVWDNVGLVAENEP